MKKFRRPLQQRFARTHTHKKKMHGLNFEHVTATGIMHATHYHIRSHLQYAVRDRGRSNLPFVGLYV